MKKSIKVVVGSENRPKCEAVRQAFEKAFQQPVQVEGLNAQSGVSDHPTTAEESIAGAKNRVQNALKLQPGADYYVGIEGGLLQVSGSVWEHGWVVIQDKAGEQSTAVSAGLELRGVILADVLAGKGLSDVMHDRFGLTNLGKKQGFYGLVTDNLITREQGYIDAIIFALAPFRYPQYFQ